MGSEGIRATTTRPQNLITSNDLDGSRTALDMASRLHGRSLSRYRLPFNKGESHNAS